VDGGETTGSTQCATLGAPRVIAGDRRRSQEIARTILPQGVTMSEKKRLDPNEIDVDSLEVEELDQVAGGMVDANNNCYSCTCPATNAA
jgi:hypothetical protein